MSKSGKYSLKERLNFSELYDNFLGLAPREQLLALVGLGLILILLIVLPITCASSRLGKMEQQITGHEASLNIVFEKIEAYKNTEARLKRLEQGIKPKSEVQLRTRLESLATQSGIGANIDSLKEKPGTPGEDYEELVVTVQLTKLSLSQVVEFLYGIESQKDLNIKVTRLQLKPRYDNRALFDINFDVATLAAGQ